MCSRVSALFCDGVARTQVRLSKLSHGGSEGGAFDDNQSFLEIFVLARVALHFEMVVPTTTSRP